MAGNNSAGSFEEDLLSSNIPDECRLNQETNKDNDKDEVCKEKCLDDEELEEDINKAKSLSIVGWTVHKRYGGGYDLKEGIIDTYDISTRFFKVKYKDGTMDTIVESVLLRCLGDPNERGFPNYIFVEPPVPEGEIPKYQRALRMNATAEYYSDTEEYESSNGEEAEMEESDRALEESVGSDVAPEESVASDGAQNTVPAENDGSVGFSSV